MNKDDGGTPGKPGSLSESRSCRAALIKQQREQLESNHCEDRATRKEGEAHPRRQNKVLGKRKRWYACRLFGTNRFKEEAIYHADPLLGNDREVSNCTTAVAK
jgi:hypothetical protein